MFGWGEVKRMNVIHFFSQRLYASVRTSRHTFDTWWKVFSKQQEMADVSGAVSCLPATDHATSSGVATGLWLLGTPLGGSAPKSKCSVMQTGAPPSSVTGPRGGYVTSLELYSSSSTLGMY